MQHTISLVLIIVPWKTRVYDEEAGVAEQLTPRTRDLEVRGPSLARRVISLDEELYTPLFFFTQG